MNDCRSISIRLITASMLAACALCANAQTPGTDNSANGGVTRAQTKADLKTLEQKGGYKPQASDPGYPNDVQSAERKAYGASGSPVAGAPSK
jgi:hypothetical protein